MAQSADEPTPLERMTATPTGGRRFKRQLGARRSPTMLPRPRPPTRAPAWPSCPPTTRRRRSRGVLEALRRDDARTSTCWSSTTAPPTARRRSPSRPGRACCGCRSTSASAAPSRPASSYAARERLRLHGPGRRRRPARPERDREAVRAPTERPDRVDMICGSRFAHRRPATSAPISRRTGIHLFAFLLSRLAAPAGDRSDVRLPALQPPCDHAVRARLPARLPRGRGGARCCTTTA